MIKFDKKSLNNINKKLKAMPQKLQRKALRGVIDGEAKKIQASFKSITPVGKRFHKNKYLKKAGSGFLKKSFSVKNSGRGTIVGRKIVTRASGYYLFMSPNETGRSGKKNGTVSGAKKYSRFWKARQNRVNKNLISVLSKELGRL